MKTILLAALLYLIPNVSSSDNNTVYISKGTSAYAYHMKKSCRTLKRCNEEGHVMAITLAKAIEMGRKPCKVCYNWDGLKYYFIH
jgi:hypothetical protein